MQIKLTLLEFKEGEYQGVKYASVHARYNGKILKFKLDYKKVGNVSNLIDKEVEADLDIVSGGNLAATIKIVSIREA